MRQENIQTCFPLHSKTHMISGCSGRRTRGRSLNGHNATQLVQTTEGGTAGGQDHPKNKKLSVENLEHFPKYTNFPEEHISGLCCNLTCPAVPEPLRETGLSFPPPQTSLVYFTVWSSLRPPALPPTKSPSRAHRAHMAIITGNLLKEQHYTTNCSLA